MHKLLVGCLFAVSAQLGAQKVDQPWSFGVELGVSGNSSHFVGGDEVANGRFHNNSAGNVGFHFWAGYELCGRVSLLGAIGFQGYAFEYLFHEDYSLVKPFQRNTRSEFHAVEFPVMIQYGTQLNCRNRRWRFSAGVVPSFIGAKTTEITNSYGPEASAAILTSNTQVHNLGTTMLRWKVSRERVLRSGNFVQASLNVNVGFNELAKSTASYRIDGKDYAHTFKNKGSYVGLSMAYYFSVKEKAGLHTLPEAAH